MLTHANTHTRKLHDTTTHMDTCRPCFFLFFEAKLTSNKLKSSDEEKSFIFCKRQIQARLWIKRNKKTASKISVFLTLLPLFLLLLYWHRINFLRNLMERVNQKPVLPFCWARHRSYKNLRDCGYKYECIKFVLAWEASYQIGRLSACFLREWAGSCRSLVTGVEGSVSAHP